METKVLSIFKDDENLIIDSATSLLKSGKVVAIPTETVYGLAGDALSDDTVKEIYKVKGRPSDNPMIVHISKIDEIYRLVDDFPDNAKILAEHFWPGPRTIILKKSSIVPRTVTGGLDTIAIRMPDCDITRKIIEKSCPLAAPSANLSGKPSPTSVNHVIADLDSKIPLIIDGGDCKVGVESTVITFATDVPTILRPGFITKEDIEKLIGNVNLHNAVTKELKSDEEATSPGMKYKHYSPNTEIVLIDCNSKEFIKFLELRKFQNIGAICFDEESDNISVKSLTIGKEGDKENHLHNLYSKLRETDLLNVETVYARLPEKQGIDLAFYNRIIRAAGHKVIRSDDPLIVGITGGSGTGKTEIAKIFSESGYEIINADEVYADILKSGKLNKVLSDAFGKSILIDDKINRKELAKRAFDTENHTKLLNDITHPAVAKEMLDIIKNSESKKIFIDVPLLFESNLDRICDYIIGTIANLDERIKRLANRDNLSKDEIALRLKAGKNDDYYKSKCQIIIDNSNNMENLKNKVSDIILKIEKRGNF
jgi:L-threonylcarbamoyladenylate synthase